MHESRGHRDNLALLQPREDIVGKLPVYLVDRRLPWLRGRPWTTCLFGFRFFLVL